ncbi:hypothetical protein [Youngiibacter fragilis]|uniref:Uncharacterized protein n=1 Tax=Youngiibacter fragilis 232.1 TaxID=994573 RepID=V7I129_9CLOT|nr:hypothetical protein [Youngiibacter fragilis]ETA79568.1 hypothetical protein T472_0216255 [Youngiibacter fragilis 232.1]
MREFGNLMGSLTAILFTIAFLNRPVKAINRRYGKEIAKTSFKGTFQSLMRFLVRNHKLFGALAGASALIHGVMKASVYGFVASGFLTLSLVMLQGILGGYGFRKMKGKQGVWLKIHRIIPYLVFLSIFNHVVLKLFW